MECSAAYCICYGNLACDKLLACSSACPSGDTACHTACMAASPNGISDAYLLADCAAMNCPAACPKTEALKPCEECLFTKCPVAANACLGNPECIALVNFAKGCMGNSGCQQMCLSAHPAGAADAQSLSFCSNANCDAQCN